MSRRSVRRAGSGNRLIAGDFTGKLWFWNVKDKTLVGELTTNP
jgi:hypothetical protein